MTTTWRIKIGDHLKRCGETWDDIIACTLTEEELDVEFDDGYGIAEGKPFTVWTDDRVLFPECYDGAEGVCSVSRNPDGRPSGHFGGGF